MTARTLRALWRNRHRIDAAFRRDPANRARFMQIFREPRGLTHELRRMNLYGILGQLSADVRTRSSARCSTTCSTSTRSTSTS